MAYELFLPVIEASIVDSLHKCSFDGREEGLFALFSALLNQ